MITINKNNNSPASEQQPQQREAQNQLFWPMMGAHLVINLFIETTREQNIWLASRSNKLKKLFYNLRGQLRIKRIWTINWCYIKQPLNKGSKGERKRIKNKKKVVKKFLIVIDLDRKFFLCFRVSKKILYSFNTFTIFCKPSKKRR